MERLDAQDLASVRGEDCGWPWDIGAIGFLDGTGLADGDGRFRIGAVRRVIEPRLHLVPHSRQLLYRPPPGLGWPLWVDAASFDIADHVRVFPLAAPGRARRSSWRRVSSCAGAAWIRHGRAGRRGSCPAWLTGGSGYSCGCTTPWRTGSRELLPSACCSTPPPGHPRPPRRRGGRRGSRPPASSWPTMRAGVPRGLVARCQV